MAKKVSEFPESLQRGRKKMYPYDEWLDGDTWELTVGEDYSGKPANVRASLANEAKQRGGKVRCAIRDEGKTMFVQFIPALAVQPGTDGVQ